MFEDDSTKPPPICEKVEQARIDAISAKVGGIDMKIIWDKGGNTVRIGEAVFDKYTNWRSRESFAKHLMHAHGIIDYNHHPKWLNKAASALVKGSVSQTYKFFKQLQYKAFVVPHIHLVKKISFSRGHINAVALRSISLHKDILNEVYEDGLYNILPLVAVSGQTPQELKKELGATWKVVAKNSLNKNKAITRAIVGKTWNRAGKYNNLDTLHAICNLPTTVLDKFNGCSVEVMQHVAQHYRGKWDGKYVKNVSPDWEAIKNVVYDTERMSKQLGVKFDPLWTPRKMNEKHEEYTRAIFAKTHSPEPIKWLENILPRFEHDGCVATLLNNRLAIANEGSEMGHCVGSYAENVAEGGYLVYSVINASGERSTLGIRVNNHTTHCGVQDVLLSKYKFSQHYRKFNRPLVDKAEQEIGKLLIEKLNRGNKNETFQICGNP